MTHETICFKNGDTYTVSQIEYPPPIGEDGEGKIMIRTVKANRITTSSSTAPKRESVNQGGSDEDGHEWYPQESTPDLFWL